MMDGPAVDQGGEVSREAVATARGRQCEECPKLIERPKLKQRFCSSTCKNAWWERTRPRMNTPGSPDREHSIQSRMVGVMIDHAWRQTQQIAVELKERDSTVARELRKLRAKGFVIESRRPGGPAEPHEYRLLTTPEAVE